MLAPPHGAGLIGQMRCGDSYRLAYIRGPEGIIVGLAEEIRKTPHAPGREQAGGRSKSLARSKPAGRNKTTRKGDVARKKRDRK